MYNAHAMNEHHRSEIAREYVREMVEQNLLFLQDWLGGVCSPEVLGAALISSELKNSISMAKLTCGVWLVRT
jgi:hypothetical protein